ncbi:MAG TPA: aquaporin family protein [Microbacterium sp.]|mgnify:FL=1|jgi:glycerol uptake facilitator-like aquaporin|uniref:Aquaporin n=2 Tax=Microbacterium TaxID=33882 RepID=A0A7S8MVT1_9MICO|nr:MULTISPECIES: aquaporin [Microbacterium]MAY48315.1 aquaporin family protein [Microbacterium sp.]MCC4267667.1 aquaporin [Microbacterium schleiferi]OJV94137.1 MAG: aquaporin family protein [Microbacterium sp. 67-17]QPE03558.1 aquaporin [Microbacterium schleiferi]WOQ68518.1 aquaporin [Microbacterium sp. Y20]|tara:strand:- start:5480 stop:6175 length:696 start_codon:yes stop_codon:yes gene_type:complete
MNTTTTEAVPLWRRAAAELLGAGLLVTVVVGSGIAASRLSPGDVGLQLLENSIATALGLTVLILIFQPVSGAHLNPVVTLADRALGARHGGGEIAVYAGAQIVGGIGGALLANLMFAVPAALSVTDRAAPGQVLGEVVATAGLILTIFALARTGRAALVAPAVGAYIGAAYWFTSSTSFANPAVTIGRIFTDTFAGIAPTSALWFLAAQVVGAVVGVGLVFLLFPNRKAQP